jgi:drug/metabolite transporter (DMT)-like permease
MLPRPAGGEGIFPEAIAMVRMVGGALFFQLLTFSRKSSSSTDLSWSALDPGVKWARLLLHARLAGLGALGIGINQALFLTGLKLSTPFTVSLIGATIPVFTASLAVVFRKERASWRTGAGLVLALSGVLWLIGVGSGASRAGLDLGAVIVSLNCLSYAAYVVFSREVVVEIGSMRLMAWVFTYAAILFSPLGLKALLLALPELSARGAVLLLYIVIVPTIVAYWLNAWALARTTASIVTIYIYLQPLLAGILAWLQLGTAISSRAVLASLLILGGVAVTTLRRRR